MIEVQDNNDSNTRLIVTANQSMSWKANLYLAASLGVVCMGVAIGCPDAGAVCLTDALITFSK